MIERLQAGDTFASAAAAHPEAFPNYYIGILSSAELTGNLDTVLDQLADYLDRDIEARSKITSAMVYPAVVAVMAVVVVIILATFVMPKFVDVLQVVQRQAAASHSDAAERVELRQPLVVGDPGRDRPHRRRRHRHASVPGGQGMASTPSSSGSRSSVTWSRRRSSSGSAGSSRP